MKLLMNWFLLEWILYIASPPNLKLKPLLSFHEKNLWEQYQTLDNTEKQERKNERNCGYLGISIVVNINKAEDGYVT